MRLCRKRLVPHYVSTCTSGLAWMKNLSMTRLKYQMIPLMLMLANFLFVVVQKNHFTLLILQIKMQEFYYIRRAVKVSFKLSWPNDQGSHNLCFYYF